MFIEVLRMLVEAVRALIEAVRGLDQAVKVLVDCRSCGNWYTAGSSHTITKKVKYSNSIYYSKIYAQLSSWKTAVLVYLNVENNSYRKKCK